MEREPHTVVAERILKSGNKLQLLRDKRIYATYLLRTIDKRNNYSDVRIFEYPANGYKEFNQYEE